MNKDLLHWDYKKSFVYTEFQFIQGLV